jgi:hypothetical protein
MANIENSLKNASKQKLANDSSLETRDEREDDASLAYRGLDSRGAVIDARELDDDARVRRFIIGNGNNILPNLPKIPGYQVFWASTTNNSDNVYYRLELGYEFVTKEDLPGWGENKVIQSGEFIGCISHKEMIAMKIRTELALRYLQHSHEDAPRAQARNIDHLIDDIKQKTGAIDLNQARNLEDNMMLNRLKKSGQAKFNIS